MDDEQLQVVLSAIDKNLTSVVQAAVDSLNDLSKANDSLASKSSSTSSSVSSGTQRMTGGFMQMASAMGAVAVAAKAFDVVKNSVGSAAQRLDTLNKYPVVMKALGYSQQDVAKSSQTLNKGIQGLPTSLNEITASAQQLAPLTGSANKAAQSAVALNNAFLASGASAADSSRGLLQYTQMLSSGKVDMMSYRTLMETMPISLRKVANAFGYTGKSAEQDLYQALQSGKISMDQLNDKFIELNGGMGGFADLAKKNSAGYMNAFENMKIATVRGVANMMASLDKALASNGLPTITQMIEKAGTAMENAFNKIGAAIPKVIAIIAPLVKHLGFLAPVAKAAAVALLGLGAIALLAPKIAPVITVFKSLFGLLKGVGSGIGGLFKKLTGIGSGGKSAGEGLEKTAEGANNAGESSGKSAGQILAMGAAIMMAAVGAAVLVGSFAILVGQVANLAKTGSQGAITFLAVAAGMAAVIAVIGIVGKMLGATGAQAAIAYAGMALLVGAFALLTMAVTQLAKTGSQGVIALTALTIAIVAITAVMGIFAPIFQACIPGLIAFGASILMVGAGVAIAAAGLALLVLAFTGLVTAITALASQGPIAIGVILALTVGIVAMTAVLAIFGPLLTASAVGLLAFGAAVLMAGVGIGVAAAGIAVLVDALSNLLSTNTVLGQIISDVWNGIKSVISGVAQAVGPIVSAGFNAMKSVATGIMNALKAVISGVWNGIKGVFNAGMSFIKSVTHADLSGNGRAIMNSFFDGLKSVWNSIKSFVSNIAGWIKAHKGPISYDRRLLIPAGQAIMRGLNSGLVNGFDNVQSTILNITDSIANTNIALPSVDTSRFNDSINSISNRMSDMGMNINGSLSSTATIDNANSRAFQARMEMMMQQTIDKLDNVDQHPVVTVDTMNTMRQYNSKADAQAYVMLKGGR